MILNMFYKGITQEHVDCINDADHFFMKLKNLKLDEEVGGRFSKYMADCIGKSNFWLKIPPLDGAHHEQKLSHISFGPFLCSSNCLKISQLNSSILELSKQSSYH